MIGKMVSLGFDLATLPARMTYRGTRAMLAMPGDIEQVIAEVRQVSDEIAREVEALLYSIDREMSLDAAERHLSMAAVNLLRALWLAVDSGRRLEREGSGVVIEHDGPTR